MIFKFRRSRSRSDSPFKLGIWGRTVRAFNVLKRKLGAFLWRFFTFVPPSWINTAKRTVYHGTGKVNLQDYFNPIYWFLWVFGFAYQWIVSRPFMNLGPASLAILVAVVITGLGVKQSLEQSDWRGQFYQATVARAGAEQNDDLVRIALTNLVSRYPDNLNYRRQQAVLADKLGKKEEATRMFAALVSERKDPDSAYWLLNNLYAVEKQAEWTEQQRNDFLNLSGVALKLNGPTADFVRAKLAQYLAAIGATDAAASNLAQIANAHAEMRLMTAMLYNQINDRPQAVKWAQLAEQHYNDLLLRNPSDAKARLALSQALIILHQEEKATRTLAEGARINQDPSMFSAGAEALVLWVERIAKETPDPKQSIPRRLQLLQSALRIAPQSQVALDAVISIAVECRDVKDPNIIQARAKLMGAVDPQVAHFIEGTIELLAGNSEAAEKHFDIAAKNGQDFPGLMNNLAVALASRNPPDLDRALELADSALKRLPKHPYVLETRGQILLKLKRYEAAIGDLESALAAPELAGPIHKSLAEAYTALGQADQAKIHLEILSALTTTK